MVPPLLFPEDPDHKLNDQARRLRAAPHRHDAVTTAIIKCSLDTTFITAATRAAGNHGENRIVGSNLATITTQLLVVCIYSTEYLHSIYRLSNYLHSIYTVPTNSIYKLSTRYLYAVSTVCAGRVQACRAAAESESDQQLQQLSRVWSHLVTRASNEG